MTGLSPHVAGSHSLHGFDLGARPPIGSSAQFFVVYCVSKFHSASAVLEIRKMGVSLCLQTVAVLCLVLTTVDSKPPGMSPMTARGLPSFESGLKRLPIELTAVECPSELPGCFASGLIEACSEMTFGDFSYFSTSSHRSDLFLAHLSSSLPSSSSHQLSLHVEACVLSPALTSLELSFHPLRPPLPSDGPALLISSSESLCANLSLPIGTNSQGALSLSLPHPLASSSQLYLRVESRFTTMQGVVGLFSTFRTSIETYCLRLRIVAVPLDSPLWPLLFGCFLLLAPLALVVLFFSPNWFQLAFVQRCITTFGNLSTSSAPSPSLSSLPSLSSSSLSSSCDLISSQPPPLTLPPPLTITDEDIEIRKKLGSGSFASVYEAVIPGGKLVAIKRIRLNIRPAQRAQQLQLFDQELAILSSVSHPNILQLLGHVKSRDQLLLITELAPLGNLRQYLRSKDRHRFDSGGGSMSKTRADSERVSLLPVGWWPEVRRMATDVVRGLEYLHTRPVPILHRDLKSENVLVFPGALKICDFGMAKLDQAQQLATISAGTIQWCAPEIIAGETYHPGADLWSLGVLFWEMATLQEPFQDWNPSEIAKQLQEMCTESPVRSPGRGTSIRGLIIPATTPGWFASLIRACLQPHPSQRGTIQSIHQAINSSVVTR
ncbi:MAG: protein kinase [archaeon]|nr:protein kinase [archaeon]